MYNKYDNNVKNNLQSLIKSIRCMEHTVIINN